MNKNKKKKETRKLGNEIVVLTSNANARKKSRYV